MKEICLQELLNLADAAAHDGICDLWNQKTIHQLVVFTSANQDFEIIGVGPTLPYTSLEAASEHVIPNKQPEFYIKCPAAIAGRLQPKLAPGINRTAPITPITPASLPSLKGRTTAPFMRPTLKMPAKAASAEQGAGSKGNKPPLPVNEPVTESSPPAELAIFRMEPTKPVAAPNLEEREGAIARREQELATLAASLKIREAALREREAALAASEESLINPPPKAN